MTAQLSISAILTPRDKYDELTEAVATVFRIGSRFTLRLIERLNLIDGNPDIRTTTRLRMTTRARKMTRPDNATKTGEHPRNPHQRWLA